MSGNHPISGGRHRVEHLKSSGNRKISSTRWLQRQVNDPFVREAKIKGYRSRAAFKIMEIDQSYKIFRRGSRVMDLGSAPGGWSQVAVSRAGHGNVFALDVVEMEPLDGVEFVRLDFLRDDAEANLTAKIGDTKFDVVMSDLAPNTSGDPRTDHMRILGLVEQAIHFTLEILKDGGTFVAKIFHGREEHRLVSNLRRYFERVDYFKPQSSRSDSSEIYIVAQRLQANRLAPKHSDSSENPDSHC
ncbi:MAG: RlmE family RNA methyltransferase [Rickettsiales bacterium]|jgi:23S rRNA (uridine2552-2'-O)-methyltransferase|nr:RlmE family RNA methyltransferase [Rickettsiales bacterium]